MTSKPRVRLDRLYRQIGRKYPATAGFLHWIRQPSARLLRLPLGLLLVLGGVFSFLPVLGIWMLPLGLMMLAVDFPPLQGPVACALIRGRRAWQRFRRKRAARTAAP